MYNIKDLATPLLIGLLPIIHLWNHNWQDVFIFELYLPVCIITISIVSLFSVILFFTKNAKKSSLVSSLLIIMCLYFGYFINHQSNWFIKLRKFSAIFSLPTYITLWIVFFVFCTYKIIKSNKTDFLNIVFIFSITAFSISFLSLIKKYMHIKKSTETISPSQTISTHITEKPNIYYIILDEYPRDDVLLKIYNYKNDLTEFLKNKNFFIAEKSCSNYSMTQLSIPSSISMSYLTITKNDRNKSFYDNIDYSPSLYFEKSPAIKFLKKIGYYFACIHSGWGFTSHHSLADYINRNFFDSPLFDNFIDMSLFGAFKRKYCVKYIKKTLAQRVLNSISTLKHVNYPQPYFVLCHILCPHSPYIFTKNGTVKKTLPPLLHTFEDKHDLIEQIQFLNKKIKDCINTILSKSPNSIIIIQSDHGPYLSNSKYYNYETKPMKQYFLKERMGILNAYYFPTKNKPDIPNDITPVNSFSTILNFYFKTDFPSFKNICYWSTVPHPFSFTTYTPDFINAIPIPTNIESD